MRVHRVYEDIEDAKRSGNSQHRSNACRTAIGLQSADRLPGYPRAFSDLLLRQVQQLSARLEVLAEASRGSLNGNRRRKR